MKFKNFSIFGLFQGRTGRDDPGLHYSIDLNLEEQVTILEGLNGSGKSTILKMINGFFSGDYSFFHKIWYQSVLFEFEDGIEVRIFSRPESWLIAHLEKKIRDEWEINHGAILWNDQIFYRDNILIEITTPDTKNLFEFDGSQFFHQQMEIYLEELTKTLQMELLFRKELIKDGRYPEYQNGTIYTHGTTLKAKYGSILDEPPVLQSLRKIQPPFFIRDTRLLFDLEGKIISDSRNAVIRRIDQYNQQYSHKIEECRTRILMYKAYKNSPHRDQIPLFHYPGKEKAIEYIISMLEKIQIPFDFYEEYDEIGLDDDFWTEFCMENIFFMSDDGEIVIPDDNHIQHPAEEYLLDERNEGELLSLWRFYGYNNVLLTDFSEFRMDARRIHDIFEELTGMNGRTKDDSPKSLGIYPFAVDPKFFSSGEQHLFIILYDLIIQAQQSSIILIDEPEISLHIGWQQRFIEIVQKIAKCYGYQVIIATHSPAIIFDRWDLAITLRNEGT